MGDYGGFEACDVGGTGVRHYGKRWKDLSPIDPLNPDDLRFSEQEKSSAGTGVLRYEGILRYEGVLRYVKTLKREGFQAVV